VLASREGIAGVAASPLGRMPCSRNDRRLKPTATFPDRFAVVLSSAPCAKQFEIVFYPNVPNPHGDYIGVLDSRNRKTPDDYQLPERFPREQLPELLRRYQDELYPFY